MIIIIQILLGLAIGFGSCYGSYWMMCKLFEKLINPEVEK